jgi:tRNA(adenine34) deaminase
LTSENDALAGQDEKWMARALDLAARAAAEGEVPVGAVLVRNGTVLGEGYNSPIGSRDPSAHAEINALRCAASAAGNYRLPGSTLYVTIEPCTMCVGALIHARVETLVFGAREPRAGAVVSRLELMAALHYNHRIQWREGVLATRCGDLMRTFFRSRR